MNDSTMCRLQRRSAEAVALILFLLISGLLRGLHAQTGPRSPYLFELPLDAANYDISSLHSATALQLEIKHARAAQLLEHFESVGVSARQSAADTLRIELNRQQVLSSERVQDRHRQASFVLDFDEPIVTAELDKIRRSRVIEQAGVDGVRRWVDEKIRTKSYRRGFDIASQVLASAEGDCTEHAVLLATLSRGLELPARVVIGVVVVGLHGGVAAFGHAWTEIYQNDRWQLVDATTVAEESSAFYIPLGELGNEGPGYAMDLLRITMTYPEQIRMLDVISR